ncbi:MAG: hypothetical protein LBJ71_03165 [Holosporaceae bacterium]|jgi:hypothetical protein|nr:hypothetical protein [Holosporaceae bacterium]
MIKIFKKAKIVFCMFTCVLYTDITEAVEGLKGQNVLINSIIDKCCAACINIETEADCEKILRVFLLGQDAGTGWNELTRKETRVRDAIRRSFEHHGAQRANAPGKHFEGTDPNCSFDEDYETVMIDFIYSSIFFDVIPARDYCMIVAYDEASCGYSPITQTAHPDDWCIASYRPRRCQQTFRGYATTIGFSFFPNPYAIKNWEVSCGSIHPKGTSWYLY